MRRSASLIYIFLLVVLAGLYYYFNNRTETVDVDTEISLPTPTPVEYLYSFDDGLPTSIHIQSKDGEEVKVARNAENAWVFILPIEASADQGSIEAAANQVTTIRVLDHIPDLTSDLVGLDDPQFTLTIQFTNDVERILEIGVLTPTESGYYVSRGDGEILIVNNSALDALIGLLTDPPYLATEIPLPTTPEADTSQ